MLACVGVASVRGFADGQFVRVSETLQDQDQDQDQHPFQQPHSKLLQQQQQQQLKDQHPHSSDSSAARGSPGRRHCHFHYTLASLPPRLHYAYRYVATCAYSLPRP